MPSLPVQVSSRSQTPVLARQTVLAGVNWQDVQQESLLSSQTLEPMKRQVVGLQQEFPRQPLSPPQSQSSPLSTIPFPHWEPVRVVRLRLETRQEERTRLAPRPEQMLPIVQGEKDVRPREETGDTVVGG